MASVKLTNVKKVYDNNVVAVHDFNLDIILHRFPQAEFGRYRFYK